MITEILKQKHFRAIAVLKLIEGEDDAGKREFLYTQYADILIAIIKKPLEKALAPVCTIPDEDPSPKSVPFSFNAVELAESILNPLRKTI